EFSNVPIVMLTAKGDDMDKILGLEYGADDYITKPFNILEVKARIKAILRRRNKKSNATSGDNPAVKEYGQLKIYKSTKRVFIEGQEVNLTTKEFDLLELLSENPDKIFSREDLLKEVWGHNSDVGRASQGEVRTVDVHVRRLREKIESSPSNPRYIHTKWGVGYYFQA
ncbi:MAG: response regulator transcription factor, partial [Eubacterium sp.]|nr:response regulator transcription factor [Eubacterium sp.]